MRTSALIKLFILLFITLNFGVQSVYAGCNEETNTNIQAIIDKNRVNYQIPGIQVSIFCPGEETPRNFTSGSTTLDHLSLVNSDHLFQIGSETKSFISTLILQLEAEGLLSITDPLSKFFPGFPTKWQKITVKQILNHSSGIYNYTDVLEDLLKQENGFDLNKYWSGDELINFVIDKPLYFEPGTDFHYSNTNYILAGMIIEAVSHHTLEEEINHRLINFLHLKNTYYLPTQYSEDIMQRMAHGYSDNGTFADEPKDITDNNHSWANAAGAMVSTSQDMAQWFMYLNKGILLPPLQMKKLTTVIEGKLPNSSDMVGYGLGIIHDNKTFGEEAWWHSGGTLGYSALMVWLKSSDVIVTVNVNHTTQNKDIYKICHDIALFFRNGHIN